jgi:hypothetical protein
VAGPHVDRSGDQVTVRPEADRVISSMGMNEVASGSRWPSPPYWGATITATARTIRGDSRAHPSLGLR